MTSQRDRDDEDAAHLFLTIQEAQAEEAACGGALDWGTYYDRAVDGWRGNIRANTDEADHRVRAWTELIRTIDEAWRAAPDWEALRIRIGKFWQAFYVLDETNRNPSVSREEASVMAALVAMSASETAPA